MIFWAVYFDDNEPLWLGRGASVEESGRAAEEKLAELVPDTPAGERAALRAYRCEPAAYWRRTLPAYSWPQDD
jgi:hypothetical protein